MKINCTCKEEFPLLLMLIYNNVKIFKYVISGYICNNLSQQIDSNCLNLFNAK